MLTDVQRKMWAYRFLGSAYDGGFTDDNGASVMLVSDIYGGTSNTEPFARSYRMGDVLSGNWGGFGLGGGSLTIRGGTIAQGTLFGSLVMFRVDAVTNNSTYGPVYATNQTMWGTFGTMYLEWTIGFPCEDNGDGFLTTNFANHLMYEDYYDVGYRPAWSFNGPHSATLWDTGDTYYVVATLIGTSISADTFVATCIFQGSNTSGADINPRKVIIVGSMAENSVMTKNGMATIYKGVQDPIFSRRGNHMLGDGWTTVMKNDIWLATFIFVC